MRMQQLNQANRKVNKNMFFNNLDVVSWGTVGSDHLSFDWLNSDRKMPDPTIYAK